MASVKGGCFCGKVRISYIGEPKAHVLCHCYDCRKISGSTYSNNVVVADENFTLESGHLKTISKVADTGKNITSHFCPDCGTTVFRTGETFAGTHIIKAGVLDDPEWANKNVPKGELFAPERVTWVPALDGAQQIKAMT